MISLSYLGLYGVFVLNFISLFFFWVSLLYQLNFFFLDNNFIYLNVGKWFSINSQTKINFDFFIDNVSFSFVVLTTSIAVFVYLYAFSYFRYEPHVDKLLIFLNLFVISMITFVISGNIFMTFFGWELVGLTSFLLINFWITRVSTLKAAFKAFVFNKFSDMFLLLFCIVILNTYGTVNIQELLILTSLGNISYLNILCFNINISELLSFLLYTAAFIKSAQIGFHIWLPDSMEAPVPASALIHSATLVSAGIFLIIRFNTILELSVYAYYVLPIIGSLTAFYGGLVASYQTDIKRILAYSTISHCGFLVVSCSLCNIEYTILYLYVHGFFKAAAFLCVGNIIRFSLNCQDIRYMGGYYKYLPFECLAIFVCFLNLSGLPFTFGFQIKHLLFTTLNFNVYNLSYLIYINILAGAITGLFYCSKIFYNVFFDFKKNKKAVYNNYKYLNYTNKLSIHNKLIFSISTFGGSIPIILLIVVAYALSFYIYVNLCSNLNLFSEISINFYKNTFFNFIINNKQELFNFSYFNEIVLFLLSMITFSVLKKKNLNYEIYYLFFNFIIFLIFFLIFLLLFNFLFLSI